MSGLAAELGTLPLLAGLAEEQLEQLAAASEVVTVAPGEELFHEGAHADSWWLLLAGEIELTRSVGREDTVVGQMDVPGRWAGGFRAWDEHGVYLATGRGKSPARVLRLPAEALRALSNEWFPFGSHLINGLYHTARSIESTARQRESLVTLGTLAAGLAHEINNPAAAATRAVDALEASTQTLLSSLARLAGGDITAAQFSDLDALRQEVQSPVGVVDALVLADREAALGTWLSRHGVEREWVIAATFAAAGIDVAWCERVADAIEGPALEAGLAWVASTLTTTVQLSELKESTRRISELVDAVRSYSQMDRGAVQHVDVTEGLDSTLAMLGHRIGDRVTVVRDYAPDAPLIDAYAGELNQVWTNLVVNAVDAMDGVGTLRVSTRPDGDAVLVSIADSGTGMPPEVAARAFEAFYSTKDVGKGTGLGLDIAWRIVVDRHGGTITIDSEPGRTVMQVRLPVELPER